jgi:hypothetical protein
MSQNEAILKHLKDGKTLTALEALHLFGSLALHSRISDLRQSGHNIIGPMIGLPNGKRVCKYRLAA